ncbi:hypothetical protein C2S51_015637 [Perilla frutescens var. frutescens]|nr:hypothetical protein C2S51_015637 [Perilla frutescens var. frutescens]
MKYILIKEKVYNVVLLGCDKTETDEKRLEMNASAMSSILWSLHDSVMRQSLSFLQEKFFKFRLDMSKDIDVNLDDFNKVIQAMKLGGDDTIKKYSATVLLNAIPNKFNDVKSVIRYGRNVVTYDIVVNGLKSKELDMKHGSSSSSKNSGEIMHVRGRTTERSKPNHASDKKKPRSKFRNGNRKCYKCNESGHYANKCDKPKKFKKKGDNSSENHANLVVGSENYGDVLMVSDLFSEPFVNFVSNSLSETEWLIDSGCTFHMSHCKSMFSNLKTVENGSVSMENENKSPVVGIGEICLKFDSGSSLTLKMDMIFNENDFPCLSDSMPVTAPSKVEHLPVLSELDKHASMPENDIMHENENVDYHEDVRDPNDLQDNQTINPDNSEEGTNFNVLQNYQLIRDRVKRTVRQPQRTLISILESPEPIASPPWSTSERVVSYSIRPIQQSESDFSRLTERILALRFRAKNAVEYVNLSARGSIAPKPSNSNHHPWGNRVSNGFVVMTSRAEIKMDVGVRFRKSIKEFIYFLTSVQIKGAI